MSSCTAIITLDVDGQSVRTTPNHPCFTATGWVNATDLRAGDEVHTQACR